MLMSGFLKIFERSPENTKRILWGKDAFGEELED